MSTIVSGTFVTFEEARAAAGDLRALSGDPGRVAEFYRSPDGHHVPPGEVSSAGDDQHEADGAGAGAAAGAGMGALAGVATGLLAGGALAPLLGAAVGAYAGSVPGAMGGAAAGETAAPAPPRRHGGPVVAIALPGPELEQAARQLLADAGARQVELAEGQIRAGEWEDYDPDSVPQLVLDRP